MANEFGITDAKAVLTQLNKEIKNSTEDTQDKERLAGLLSVVVNMPDLLKEKKAIDDAISKSRGILTILEDDVKREEEGAAAIISVLRKAVLDEETHVSEVKQEKKEELDALVLAHEKLLGAERKRMEAGITTMRERGAAEKERYDNMKTEHDAMEAKLKAFKQTVASM